MKITAYVYGRQFGSKGAACSLILESYNEELRHATRDTDLKPGSSFIWKRSLKLGDDLTTNQAELKSILFALKSINPKLIDRIESTIKTTNRYVIKMLSKEEDGRWKAEASNNVEIIEEIRSLLDNVKMELCNENDCDHIEELKEMSREAASGNLVFKKIPE